MRNNIINLFLSNVETLVDERDMSKQAFCDTLGFSRSSFINWKKQNSLPNADTVIKIANFFNVDPKWLITGNIDLPENIQAWPQSIFERVYHMLLEETGIPNPDYHDISLEQQEKIWLPVVHIVSRFDLFNWQFNRIIPSYTQIEGLAEHFHKPLSYIAAGRDDSIPDYIETYKVPKVDYDNYKKYEKYKSLFWSYDAMYKPDKKYIEQLIKRLFRLRLFSENQDFDFDYNREHPLEAPRQKDPNISDEEYDEIYKKSRNGL